LLPATIHQRFGATGICENGAGHCEKQIRELKAKRAGLIDAGDHKGLKEVRRRVRALKRQIRKIHAAAPVTG
jgi:hypothetical protein